MSIDLEKAESYVGERRAKCSAQLSGGDLQLKRKLLILRVKRWPGKWGDVVTWGQLSQEATCSAILFQGPVTLHQLLAA